MNLHVLVPIRNYMTLNQPFGSQLHSNIVIATVLSYLGTKTRVYSILKILSHRGRSFCIQQDGLKGFIKSDPAYFNHFSRETKELIWSIEDDCFLGKLHEGKKHLEFNGFAGEYVGELNQWGEAHGNGRFVDSKNGHQWYGTFKHNNVNGMGICILKTKYYEYRPG